MRRIACQKRGLQTDGIETARRGKIQTEGRNSVQREDYRQMVQKPHAEGGLQAEGTETACRGRGREVQDSTACSGAGVRAERAACQKERYRQRRCRVVRHAVRQLRRYSMSERALQAETVQGSTTCSEAAARV